MTLDFCLQTRIGRFREEMEKVEAAPATNEYLVSATTRKWKSAMGVRLDGM